MKNIKSLVTKRWKHVGVPELGQQGVLLRKGIRLLLAVEPKPLHRHSLSLSEQPFDTSLLRWSSLYRKSRKLYLDQGGRFLATLVSSPRTLSSPQLLDPLIEYSPIERELIWTATDPIESKNTDRLLGVRGYCSSLFHEQNHRILWDQVLPSAPPDPAGMRRFLNFAESLVITLDVALGDQLGPALASILYLTGVIYDPGTSVREELSDRRKYRNYLQASLHATYLHLELFDPKKIPQVIEAMFPGLGPFAKRAAVRSGNLDQAFIQYTNLKWQRKHRSILAKKLSIPGKPILELSADPMDNRQQYLIAEKCFDLIGL